MDTKDGCVKNNDSKKTTKSACTSQKGIVSKLTIYTPDKKIHYSVKFLLQIPVHNPPPPPQHGAKEPRG